MEYKTSGVCAIGVSYDIKDGKVYNVSFEKGCNGNLKGLSSLAEGLDVNVLIEKLEGTTCGGRSTSCPDQLAKALKEYIENN